MRSTQRRVRTPSSEVGHPWWFACVVGAMMLGYWPASTRAAGMATVDLSVAAMGTGGTGTARVDDPAASVYNPGATLFQTGLRGSLGATMTRPSLSAKGDGWTATADERPQLPPHAHLVLAGESWSVGASLTTPFGSSIAWPDEWQKRFNITEARLVDLRVSGFFGVRLGSVGIAAGPFFDSATLASARRLDFVDPGEEGQASVSARARGMGGQVGVLIRAADWLDLGFSYRSRVKLSFSGYADFERPLPFQSKAPDGAVSTVLTLPDRIAVGGRFGILPTLTLFADLETYLWGTVDEMVFTFSSGNPDPEVKARGWHNTIAPRLGLEWQPFASWLTLRGGTLIDPSPVPSTTLGPDTPDSTRWGLSAGVGVDIPGGFFADLAYQRLQFVGARATDEVRYSGHADLLALSVGYSLR